MRGGVGSFISACDHSSLTSSNFGELSLKEIMHNCLPGWNAEHQFGFGLVNKDLEIWYLDICITRSMLSTLIESNK